MQNWMIVNKNTRFLKLNKSTNIRLVYIPKHNVWPHTWRVDIELRGEIIYSTDFVEITPDYLEHANITDTSWPAMQTLALKLCQDWLHDIKNTAEKAAAQIEKNLKERAENMKNNEFIEPGVHVYFVHEACEDSPICSGEIETVYKSEQCADVYEKHLGSICVDFDKIFATRTAAEAYLENS